MDNSSELERAERIDRYLTGNLSVEEMRAFEAAMDQDQALRREYEDSKIAQALAQDYGLRDQIKSIRQAMLQESASSMVTESVAKTPAAADAVTSEPEKVKPLFRPLSAYAGRIAAGVAILLVGFLGYQYATLSGGSLYAEKATPYRIAASRSAEAPEVTPESSLEQQYQSQQFSEVTATYEQMSAPSSMAMFLAGNAYLQEGQTDLAIDAFHKIVSISSNQGINRFEEDAQYYLALSYLKADRVEQALPLLERINANSEHSYHSFVSDYYLWKVKFLNRVS